MFPLKRSFNKVVGHLIKLIKFAFSALLLLFVLLARLHSTENLQTGHALPWEVGKNLNQKRKENKCLNFSCLVFTDHSPMHSHKCPPTFRLDEERFCSDANIARIGHKEEQWESAVSHQTWELPGATAHSYSLLHWLCLFNNLHLPFTFSKRCSGQTSMICFEGNQTQTQLQNKAPQFCKIFIHCHQKITLYGK